MNRRGSLVFMVAALSGCGGDDEGASSPDARASQGTPDAGTALPAPLIPLEANVSRLVGVPGGYLAAGEGLEHGVFLKLDEAGKTVWKRDYGGRSLQIRAGATPSIAMVDRTGHLWNTSMAGDLLDEKQLITLEMRSVNDALLGDDGGALVIVNPPFPQPFRMVKLAPGGSVEWDKEAPALTFGMITAAASDGWLVSWWKLGSTPMVTEACLQRVTANGESPWTTCQTCVGSPRRPLAVAGGYVLGGQRSTDNQACVTKIDDEGKVAWTLIPTVDIFSSVRAVLLNAAGNLIIAGGTGYGPNNYLFFTEADLGGNEMWTKKFRGPGDVYPIDLAEGAGEYLLAGGLDRFPEPTPTFFLLRVSRTGDPI